MPGRPNDVGGMSARLQDARKDIDRGQYLEGAIDGRPAQTRVGRAHGDDELLGREWPISPQHCLDDDPARLGQAIAMLTKNIDHLGDRWQCLRSIT